MRNSILTATLVSAAIMGGLVGGAIQDHRIHTAEEDAWSEVLVVRGGTLIANPSAMTPRELADSQIIKRDPEYIAFCGSKAYVGDTTDIFDIGSCKELKSVDQATAEAVEFEAI